MVKQLEQKIGWALWQIVCASVATIVAIVGAIAWANSVDNNATMALRLGEENKQRIEVLSQQLIRQDNNLTELRVDVRYLITAVNEVKETVKARGVDR
jgi:hypothetical protein